MDHRCSHRSPVVSGGPISGANTGSTSIADQSAVGPAHGILRVNISTPCTDVNAAGPSSKRQRKERCPNWSSQEVAALIDAKCILCREEEESTNARESMVLDAGKWLRISVAVMRASVSQCHRDGPACKSKWNQLIPDYKRIVDFLARSGTNELSYWNMSAAEKKGEALPRAFPLDVFNQIHEWYGRQPSVTPVHTRDLLSNDDSNYKTPVSGNEAGTDGDYSDDFDDNAGLPFVALSDSEDMTTSTQSPTATTNTAKGRASAKSPCMPPSTLPALAVKHCNPLVTKPQLISSSDTADGTCQRHPPITGVRRKSVSGHSLIAEATRTIGEAMTSQMKHMADANQELEKTKIDVQQRLFSEQMLYQKERDHRLQENARQANENAKLSIQKQGEVVSYLAQLAAVLGGGLLRTGPSVHALPMRRADPTTSPHTPPVSTTPADEGPMVAPTSEN